MQANRSRDTAPERELRSALHRLGLRFRKHVALLPHGRGRADVVFTRAKVAVFLDGCFWHGCPEHATNPEAHRSYWAPKLRRNRDRDTETSVALRESGWTVLRIWEHEDLSDAAGRVEALYRDLRKQGRGGAV